MSEAVTYTVHDGVAVIAMNNPPVNGLGSVLRPGIMDGLQKAAADPAVKALVIMGTAKAFSGGADIREFNTPKSTMSPTMAEIQVVRHGDVRRAKLYYLRGLSGKRARIKEKQDLRNP